MSILANKKISIAKSYCVSIDEMPSSQLPEFMKARICKGKLTDSEVADRAGMANSYISELRRGIKDGQSMTAEAIIRLAKGMQEPSVLVFQAIIGKMKPAVNSESLQQVLEDFSQLPAKDQNDLAFMIEQLKRMVGERLDRNS